MPKETKRDFRRYVRKTGSDWLNEQPVRLGNDSGVVETGIPGRYYARQFNGAVITVTNSVHAPPDFDLHVLVRRSKFQPNIWQITEILEDYDDPATGGRLAYHHEQHEEAGPDRLALDRKQIKQLSIRVSGTWKVFLYGAAVTTPAGIVLIPNQELDLSSYVITAGAKYISIETDEDGTISINDGTPVDSPLLLTVADIPPPDPGKYLLGFVLFYDGQPGLSDVNIRVPMPLSSIPAGTGTQIGDAPADTPGPSDLFGFWDIVDELLKSITWEDLLNLLEGEFAPLIHDHEGGGGSGHVHGLARWNGASGQDTFDLPDVAEYLESVTLNGLDEDPFGYSLSSDGTQILFEDPLSSDTLVIAHYVIGSI
jgi:hypothetical protein